MEKSVEKSQQDSLVVAGLVDGLGLGLSGSDQGWGQHIGGLQVRIGQL